MLHRPNLCCELFYEDERIFRRVFGCVPQLRFEMVCERPPAAFGGSPPHREGENKVISPSWGVALHTISNQSWALQPCATRSPDNPSALIFRIYSLTGNCIGQEN
jgi:hypothetical protein